MKTKKSTNELPIYLFFFFIRLFWNTFISNMFSIHLQNLLKSRKFKLSIRLFLELVFFLEGNIKKNLYPFSYCHFVHLVLILISDVVVLSLQNNQLFSCVCKQVSRRQELFSYFLNYVSNFNFNFLVTPHNNVTCYT